MQVHLLFMLLKSQPWGVIVWSLFPKLEKDSMNGVAPHLGPICLQGTY